MNTTQTTRRATHATAASAPTRMIRVLGIVILAGTLVAILPQAFVPEGSWASARTLLAWTSLGLPVAFAALGALMWRTSGASRATAGAALLAAVAVAVDIVVTAIGGEFAVPKTIDQWITVIAFVLLHVALLDTMMRTRWALTLRALLGVVVSWPLLAFALSTIAGDGIEWWAAFGTLTIGFAAVGIALAAQPTSALASRLAYDAVQEADAH